MDDPLVPVPDSMARFLDVNVFHEVVAEYAREVESLANFCSNVRKVGEWYHPDLSPETLDRLNTIKGYEKALREGVKKYEVLKLKYDEVTGLRWDIEDGDAEMQKMPHPLEPLMKEEYEVELDD